MDFNRINKDLMDECARRYYSGFKYKEPMHNEELTELDDMYVDRINTLSDELESMEPIYLRYMQEFLTLKNSLESLQSKLSALRQKRFGSAPV